MTEPPTFDTMLALTASLLLCIATLFLLSRLATKFASCFRPDAHQRNDVDRIASAREKSVAESRALFTTPEEPRRKTRPRAKKAATVADSGYAARRLVAEGAYEAVLQEGSIVDFDVDDAEGTAQPVDKHMAWTGEEEFMDRGGMPRKRARIVRDFGDVGIEDLDVDDAEGMSQPVDEHMAWTGEEEFMDRGGMGTKGIRVVRGDVEIRTG